MTTEKIKIKQARVHADSLAIVEEMAASGEIIVTSRAPDGTIERFRYNHSNVEWSRMI